MVMLDLGGGWAVLYLTLPYLSSYLVDSESIA